MRGKLSLGVPGSAVDLTLAPHKVRALGAPDGEDNVMLGYNVLSRVI
jgi:hypothetical protein